MPLTRRFAIRIILVPPKELPAMPFADGPFGGTRGWRTPMRRLSLPTRGRIRTEIATRLAPVWRPWCRPTRLGRPVGGGRGWRRRVPPDAWTRLACTRVVDDQRSPVKRLRVEAADGLLRLRRVVEFDKGNPPRPPAVSIRREMDEDQGADGREILPHLGFGDVVRQIPHKESHRHGPSPRDPRPRCQGWQAVDARARRGPPARARPYDPSAPRARLAARAAGWPTAPRLRQFHDAGLVLRLGQPVNPRRAPRPPPRHPP